MFVCDKCIDVVSVVYKSQTAKAFICGGEVPIQIRERLFRFNLRLVLYSEWLQISYKTVFYHYFGRSFAFLFLIMGKNCDVICFICILFASICFV